MREQAGQLRGAAADGVRASRKAWWKSVAFGTGVGVFLGLVGAFDTAHFPFWQRMPVFTFIGVGCGLLVWPCVELAERLRFLSHRPFVSRLFVAFLVAPLTGAWVWLVISFLFLGGYSIQALLISVGYAAMLTGPMAVLGWLIFKPRIVHAPPASPSSKFLERLPFRLRDGELYAVEAEDHYLRIRTSKGSDLILMRLSDAISELDGLEGAQTHRSWWVAKAGVADVRRSEGRAVLILKDGSEAPVSRTHGKTLRSAGWL